MVQLANPRQQPIGLFGDLQTAETALNAVQEAGFSVENLSVMPQSLEPNPVIEDTEAKKSAGGGAIAGALSGAIGGLLFSYMSLNSPGTPDPQPISNAIGLVLAASGIGAAGGGLIAALSGAGVHKGAADPEYADLAHNYLVVAENTTPQDLAPIQEILRHCGSQM
jgi:hypothetical protein